uniref:Uncharacterized protein n=1 Tax=Tetranychus urticae TaxID=32264 RepID=T1JWV9_TETUR
MDPKLYLIQIINVLSLINLSNQCQLANCFGSNCHEYYMNIKTSVDLQWMHREDNAQWRNDSLFETIVDRVGNRCKVQLDHRDNCYLYLVKNQTKPTLHGPIKIDPKHIELNIEFDKLNRVLEDPWHKKFEKRLFEIYSEYHARCHLMRLAYKIPDYFCYTPLNIYLELDSKTASLFPKIEKNDYFMLNIINFFDEINPNNVLSKSKLQAVLLNFSSKWDFVTASHVISNYTVVPIEKFNQI